DKLVVSYIFYFATEPDYYNLLHFILFEIDIKYVKFMAQLMYAPENLSQTVMKLLLKFKKVLIL
ncbi:hypothetical protein RPO35_00615, partial [Staphylococcus hominis]|nr:hypothetical protein [Staphylococcus hominis]